ncbi:GNAT family N-acetyltransferase [Sneathiella marina]|uniref:GNAT family N-acetyltransferase n=1 Tax=Sneathiella marina TaxID=2950108 RepID=A0ABY4W1J7_9PROT|nr:GNAT family N-acetyltransferase [Sneathiella marina]USG60819.1 GNAT family N-acetyltransferase [Sneathiella marina]
MLTIKTLDDAFDNWDALLTLVHDAFSYMNDRIDPPSSVHLLDKGTLTEKAAQETVLIAYKNQKLIGCCFIKEMGEKNYLGKMAVDPDLQGTGVGEELLKAVVEKSKNAGKSVLELESRVELTEVHSFFRRFGFVQTAETAHEGYNRPTSITMQLEL